MATRDTAIQRVARKIGDIGSGASGNANVTLSDTEIGEEVDAAVVRYSLDNPRIRVVDVTGITSPYVNVTSLTGWVTRWSRLLSVEWQAAAVGSSYTPALLDLQDDLELYQDGSNHYVWLKTQTPVSGDTTRFRYTTPHTLDNSTDTIPTPHFDAVCDLAAAYCCRRLQANYAGSSDTTIVADAVNYRDSQLRYRQAAQDFEMQYRQKVGIAEGVAAAGKIVDWDTGLQGRPQWGWLTHRNRWR